MKTEVVKISKVKANKNNPRIIKDEKFKSLVKSIKEFPEMLKIRPIVVDNEMVVLGGNMRLKACKEAGLTEVPIIKASELTEDQQKEFIIKDNVGFGEWDWDMLANEWENVELNDWGMDVWQNNDNIFEIEEDEEEEEGKTPSAQDDNYSTFELIMFHEDKLFVLGVLNEMKIKLNLKTTAHALFVLAKNKESYEGK